MGTPVFLCSHRHLLYNTKGEHCFLVSSTASVLFSFQQHNLINQDNCQGENLWQLPLQKALILQSVLTAHPSYGWATRGLAWAQDARLQLLKCFSQIDAYQRSDFSEPRFLHLPIHRKSLYSLAWIFCFSLTTIFWCSDYLPFVAKYSLDILLFQFGISLLFHVQF